MTKQTLEAKLLVIVLINIKQQNNKAKTELCENGEMKQLNASSTLLVGLSNITVTLKNNLAVS